MRLSSIVPLKEGEQASIAFIEENRFRRILTLPPGLEPNSPRVS